MSARGNKSHFMRGKSATRRSMLIACGAVCSTAMLSFMAPSAQAQSSFTWTSATSGNWSNGGNWMGGTAPTVGVDSTGDVSLEFNAPGAYTATNDIPGTYGVFNATFDAGNGPTTLSGNDIYLSDPTAEPLNPFFTNNSTNPVTVNNNVAFGLNNIGTTEQFVLAPGSTTTFNGTMTLNGGSALTMRNGEPNSNLGGPGGTMIWTQPVTFTNVPNSPFLPYFSFRIYEGTFEMGGYTIDNGISDAPLINIDGVNIFPSSGVNNANP